MTVHEWINILNKMLKLMIELVTHKGSHLSPPTGINITCEYWNILTNNAYVIHTITIIYYLSSFLSMWDFEEIQDFLSE